VITKLELHEIRSRVWQVMLAIRNNNDARASLELGKLDDYIRDLQVRPAGEEEYGDAPF